MLEECIRVLQSTSLKDWALPAATLQDCLSPDGETPDEIGRYFQANETSTLRCKPPNLLDRPSERSLFFPHGSLKESYDVPLAALRLDAIPQAQIVGEKFVVISHDLKVFSESYWAEQNLNDGIHFFHQPSTIVGAASIRLRPTILFHDRPPKRRIDGPAILLGNPWSFNYHHWTINCLSRLWWADRYPELRDVPIIVPGQLKPFQRESLTAMGISNDRILPFDGGPWLVERLFFPTNGVFWPTQLQWIRQRLFDHYQIVDAAGDRLLYISREDAPGRRLVNEQEVTKYLTARGFEILQLSGMPLREQILAFSQARRVVGPHGSGLTNVMFGAKNLAVVELHPNDEINHVFWVLANAMKQPYAFVSGKKINPARDFIVEVADLEAAAAATGG